MKRTLFEKIALVCCIALSIQLFTVMPTVSRVLEMSEVKALEALESQLCSQSESYLYYKDCIPALDYSKRRAFNAFVSLPDICPEQAIAVLEQLFFTRMAFNHVLALERFCLLPGVKVEDGWQLLNLLAGVNYSVESAVSSLMDCRDVHPVTMLALVKRLKALDEPGLWAAKTFFSLPGQTSKQLKQGMTIIEGMREKQRWAVEAVSLSNGMDSRMALSAMEQLIPLSDRDVWNANYLFRHQIGSPARLNSWLHDYFRLTSEEEDTIYFILAPADKSLLLQGFADASEYLIWKINNLHAVTNSQGREIASATLARASDERLTYFFKRLDPTVQETYKQSFYLALKKKGNRGAVKILRKATGSARGQAARDLTSANIYILLSRGSELYDSSFRDILVPVLKQRIEKEYDDHLLTFLLAVDPGNKFISDFIISLAQKGKLTLFFPKQAEAQEKVLDLVAESAFQDENSLILFSATFMKLLQNITPETRSYFIAKMLDYIHNKNTSFTVQLRVILQYYIQEYPDLIGGVDKIKIEMMMYKYGVVPLSYFTRTAFGEWKKDGRLSSLSVFHSDDDGRQSFSSNCMKLYEHGYRPRVSSSFTLTQDDAVVKKLTGLVKKVKAKPGRNLPNLFRFQVKNPVVVDWVKNVSGLELSHSIYVYQGKSYQKDLFGQFLRNGHEMFAQRGHSYWRKEQLIEPIEELLKDGTVTRIDMQSKQRFMSVGSCGGIRVYSKLNIMFANNVDILATVGTGKAVVNDPYNQQLFELVAKSSDNLSWEDVARNSSRIFKRGLGEDYLQPGSLPAILHKIKDRKKL